MLILSKKGLSDEQEALLVKNFMFWDEIRQGINKEYEAGEDIPAGSFIALGLDDKIYKHETLFGKEWNDKIFNLD